MGKDNLPQISVLLPAYNCELFIEKAINSILSQTYTDFELIIINDGSTDNTLKIIKKFKDNRIRLINQENKGFAKSLNNGLKLCQGKYIARMDGDDISLPNRFELQMEFMEKNRDVSLVGGQAIKIDANDYEFGKIKKPVTKNNVLGYIKYACPIIHPTYFVRKEVYDKIGGYIDFPPVEDYEFLLRLNKYGFKIDNLSNIILKYRINESGMSSFNIKKTMQRTSFIQDCYKNGISIDEKILASIRINSSAYFDFIAKVRNWALLKRKISKSKILKALFVIVAFGISLFHHLILKNTLNGILSLRYLKE